MRKELDDRVSKLVGERERHLAALKQEPQGIAWCLKMSDIADEVIRAIYDDLVERMPDFPALAIIATGGYGRREMSPHSDVDLTIVPSDDASPLLDSIIRELFQNIHEAFITKMRVDVGYAYRLISDAPGLDAKTRTGLLDMRLVVGSYPLFEQLERALMESFEAGEFILAKIREREEMLERYHDTPLVVEPQLKEGAGGLRCFHCANWIRSSIGERPARTTVAFDHLTMVRNLLHLHAGRHQDLLSRSRQEQIADHLGLPVGELMAEVVSCGAEMHAHYLRVRERIHETRFELSRGVMAVQGEARIVGHADAGEAAVGIALATELGLRVSDLALPPIESVLGPAAVFAVSNGERTLRNLDRCGLLETLVPELTACRTLVPGDPIHEFTVFEHTLRVIRNLDRLDPGSFLGDIMASLNSREVLYLAALFHDIGKTDSTRSHSEVGADLAARICRRWNLTASTSDTVQWLIREHLTMARFIRIRDIQNPATVSEFAEIVGTLDRLDFLSLLTWADVTAVSNNAWTPAQETFMKELHGRTAALLQGEVVSVTDAGLSRQRLLRQLRSKPEDSARLQAFLDSLPLHYLTSTPPELVKLHLELADKAAAGEPTVELFTRTDISATEVTVCAQDAPALLNRLLGTIYAQDLVVTGIRASTTTTEPPIALDVFTINFAGRPIPSATAKTMVNALQDVLHGRLTVEDLLLKRGKDPTRRQQILSYSFVAGALGVLEIRAPRGRGMPYRLSRIISEQGWNVVAARVGQWAGNAAAAFYITGEQSRPLCREEVDRVFEPR